MLASKFVEGYSEISQGSREPIQGQRIKDQTLMELPEKWASFFNRMLTKALANDEKYSPEYIVSKLNDYNSHENQTRLINLTRFYSLGQDELSKQHLHFHAANQAMMPMWKNLIIPEIYPSLRAPQISTAQTKLAIISLQLSEAYYKQIGKNSYDDLGAVNGSVSPEVSRSLSYLMGQINEADAGIALLEYAKLQTPNVSDGTINTLVLPSPPTYESSYTPEGKRNRNSDYIVLKQVAEQLFVHGIQVKSTDTPMSRQIYDWRYVSLVFGNTDLTNFADGKAAPGRLAANFIASVDEKKISSDTVSEPVSIGSLRHAQAVANLIRDKIGPIDYDQTAESVDKISPRINQGLSANTGLLVDSGEAS